MKSMFVTDLMYCVCVCVCCKCKVYFLTDPVSIGRECRPLCTLECVWVSMLRLLMA